MFRVKKILLAVALVGLFVSVPASACVLRWDWDNIDVHDLHFPQNFLFGVASSAYQVEGGCDNNQYIEHECVTRQENGKLFMPEYSGDACDQWNRYQEDVQLIANLHANAYRFSIEWSKIEPQEGVFDEAVLQHYVDLCDELLRNGIAPVITIHHYAEPIWFAQKGGFENEENIFYYVRYAEKLFERLHNRVHLWLTFNSPAAYSMQAYGVGMRPPYKNSKQLAMEVLKNVLEAHVRAYRTMKAMPGGRASKIGILKNIHQIDPLSKWDLVGRTYAAVGNRLMNRSMYRFFSMGEFEAYIPFVVNVRHVNRDARDALDFVGLNYYSHCAIKGTKRFAYPGEIEMKKEHHTIYAEGLYRALCELHGALSVPIYVTENGIAPRNEQERDIFLKQYLYALSRAYQHGIPVRGYFYWSLLDNYEWGSYEDRYGLYHVDFATQERTLKESAQHFVDVAERFAQPYRCRDEYQRAMKHSYDQKRTFSNLEETVSVLRDVC